MKIENIKFGQWQTVQPIKNNQTLKTNKKNYLKLKGVLFMQGEGPNEALMSTCSMEHASCSLIHAYNNNKDFKGLESTKKTNPNIKYYHTLMVYQHKITMIVQTAIISYSTTT